MPIRVQERLEGQKQMEDRKKLANGKKVWVIKAGFPDTPQKMWWSEYAFSRSLKKYLERLGFYVVVEGRAEWDQGGYADVVVVMRGHEEYFPDRKNRDCIYIMWNLSHPDTISDEEYNLYDMVCVSSITHERKVRERLNVPVRWLPMCADTELFYPSEEPDKKPEYEWIFVGNSKYIKRKSVVWAINNDIPLKIWGDNWEKIMPEISDHIVAENIPNDELPELYRKSMVTVDDHYEDMLQNGFINTRIVEAFACGLPVISDYSEVLKEMFGDAILCYHDEAEFVARTKEVVENYAEIKEKVLKLWPMIDGTYSFRACTQKLAEFSEEIENYRRDCIDRILDLYNGECIFSPLCRGDDTNAAIQKLYKDKVELTESLRSVRGEKSDIYQKYRKVIAEKEENKKEIERLKENLEKIREEKSIINSKLQKTYKEKSEINRKLQITYGEKYDRGQQIKRLEKELRDIKASETYRLARMLGAPVRCLRKILQKLRR